MYAEIYEIIIQWLECYLIKYIWLFKCSIDFPKDGLNLWYMQKPFESKNSTKIFFSIIGPFLSKFNLTNTISKMIRLLLYRNMILKWIAQTITNVFEKIRVSVPVFVNISGV